MKVMSIMNVRPNFMKITPFVRALQGHYAEHVLVHTGQHYDHEMFKSFFDEFQLPKPDVNLAMRSGSYACQIGQTMDARIVLTDNGCLQEETTVLSVPCLTLRWNTERPVTLIEDGGTSQLVGNNPTRILDGFQMPGTKSRHTCPPALRNGHTAERIVQRILQ